jgi:type IV secretory pathway ATPase VirB11/archaellum biosynthesis ATPase
MNNLNTQNPDFLTWTDEQIQFDILGGIRLEGLDRLRVTVRATYDGIIIRHNVDLYNDNQLTQLVRKCAERFEISSSFMYPIVGQLVNLLEDYRIKEINALKESSNTKKKELSEEEAEAASQLLKTPNLLETINDLIGKSGVIGEESNRLLMYIIFTSRLMSNPLHIISMGASGTGKSHLQETVGELIPEEDRMSITDLSESSFYYFKSGELSHKLILIEDLYGA